MSDVLRFPDGVHVCASDLPTDSAKASKVMCKRLRLRASFTSSAQRPGGIPLSLQVLTVERGKPRSAATGPVPPKSSITESAVRGAITPLIVRNPRTSQEFANRETTFDLPHGPIGAMIDPPHIIGPRLKALRIACGYRWQKDFAKEIGVEKNTYNPWETEKRELTFEGALLIRKRFRVPLDYLFFGELVEEIPGRILKRLQEAA